jgi:hypothetical protein
MDFGVINETDGNAIQTGTIYNGFFDRNMPDATGSVAYTGVGFQPRYLHIRAAVAADSNTMSVGTTDSVTENCWYQNDAVARDDWNSGFLLRVYTAASINQTAVLTSFDSDGFTLAWTRNGATVAGTLRAAFIAYK